MQKIKIIFIIYSLARGGAERIFSIIANNIDKDKFDVTFLVINSSYDNTFFLNKNGIRLIELNCRKTIIASKKLYHILKKQNFDIVFSTIGQVNIVVGAIKVYINLLNKNTPTFYVMRETSIPSINNLNSQYPANLLSFLIKYFYPKFDTIIAQGVNMKADLVNNFNIKPNQIKVINNPVKQSEIKAFKTKNIEDLVFITVGNLTTIKGHDRLLLVIKLLVRKYNFKYYIVGDGVEETNIRKQVKELGLEEYCVFTGSISNVNDYLAKADFFLQGSYYEGFPNALLEATQMGIPVIAFDVPGGTNELIIDGFNGFLTKDGDIDSFVSNVEKAIMTPFNQAEIRKWTTSAFSQSKIISEYEELFLSLTNNTSNA